MALTYEEITLSIVVEASMTRVAFEKLTIEQRVFLINRHLGVTTSRLYETLDKKQVIVLKSDKTQGKFNYTFAHIDEATSLFKSISTLLNTTLFGIYNPTTRYFMLIETFKSLMRRAKADSVVDHVLSRIHIKDAIANVSVASIGNYNIGISTMEIKDIIYKFTKTVYDSNKLATKTELETRETFKKNWNIIVESLLLSLLDVKLDEPAALVLENLKGLEDKNARLRSLGDNLVKKENLRTSDNFIELPGLKYKTEDGKDSHITVYNDGTIDGAGGAKYNVDVYISSYISGGLEIYFGGDLKYNDNPTNGTITFKASVGSDSHTSLVIQSTRTNEAAGIEDPFKGTISNISVRVIA